MNPTRRRGLLLLCFALVCGGLAASQVRERERRSAAAVGPLVSVVAAKRELPAGRRLRSGDLAVRQVPARYAPPDAVSGAASAELAGARTAVAVAAGGYLTAGILAGTGAAGEGPAPLRPGERALEVAVAGAPASAEPGTRVDVLVTAGGEEGAGRTFVALENIELLGLRAGPEGAPGAEGGASDAPGAGAAPGALATLRVNAREAVYLTAAANFAQEVRLLARPPGDRERVGAASVAAGGL